MFTLVTLTSAYTFDPLNGIWKPSGRSSTSSSASSSSSQSSSSSASASPYGHYHTNYNHHHGYQHQQQHNNNYYYGSGGTGQYSSSATPYASQPGLGDDYYDGTAHTIDGSSNDNVQAFEEDVIRAQYSTWAGRYHNDNNGDDGETFRQTSLVQIEYNKKTGEVSLVDQDGIITPEDYQRLMKIVMMEEGGREASQTGPAENVQVESGLERPATAAAGVAMGSTLYVDAEDLDQTKVIDTDAEVLSSETIPLTHEQQQQLQQHTYGQSLYDAQNAAGVAIDADSYQHLHQDQTYHEHDAYSQHQPPPTVEMPISRPASFNSYNIPQSTSVSATYQQYQRQTVATATATSEVGSADSNPRGSGFGFNQRRKAFM